MRSEIAPAGTIYWFEYISDAEYQANVKALGPGEGFSGAAITKKTAMCGGCKSVSANTGKLANTTEYHYRAVATNPPPDENEKALNPPEHVFTTTAFQNAFKTPPDGRKWEMVSPIDKNGGAVAAPEDLFGGGDFQAAAAGPAITYGSSTAFGEAKGSPPSSQYISSRTPSGWVTQNVSTPLESAAYGDKPDGAPYRVFSPDLAQGLLFGGLACRGDLPGCPAPNPVLPGTGAPPGFMAYYQRASNGALSSLLTAANFSKTNVSTEDFEISLAGATPDLSHIVLSSCAALTLDAKEVAAPGGCAGQNLYEWSEGTLKAINLLPGDTETTPGALLAAPIGAISDDGTRVYVTQLEDGPIYLREGTQSKEIAGTVGELAEFQTASSNGRFAFYTKGGHLYRWDATNEVAGDLTPPGGVKGVLGASTDGSTVYYEDVSGIERWHEGTTAEVVAGSAAALPGSYPPSTGTARVSPDGEHLAFLSDIELDGHDNLDADNGLPHVELYLYGPPLGGGAPRFVCVSCHPTGERPEGSASIPGALVNGTTQAYRPRVLSADGNRIFFTTPDDLATGDTNSDFDAYQWEAFGRGGCVLPTGCINLISSGRGSEGAFFIDASANGDDAYFITNESLAKADPGSIDLYDARVGGGFPEIEEPIPCIADACQALPSPPEDPTPGTLGRTPGNPPFRIFRERRHPKKHRVKGHKRGHKKKHGKRHRGR